MAGLGKVESAWSRFGSMINSGLIVLAALGMIYTFGVTNAERDGRITNLESKLEEIKATEATNWTNHLQLHKDRLGEVKERDGRYEQRFAGIEKDLRRTDQLEYRLTIQEQQQVATSAAIKEIATGLNSQAGDLKVIKEVVQRLEANGRSPSR